MGSILLVGASGILAPAASSLVARGVPVTGIARRHAMPIGVEPLHVDASVADALRAALGDHRWSAAIVYEPAVASHTLPLIAVVADRVIRVRTTAAVDPSRGHAAVPPDVLQLGWTQGGNEPARWHTPAEVSAAVLEVLDDGRARTLGEIRPWERRPRSAFYRALHEKI